MIKEYTGRFKFSLADSAITLLIAFASVMGNFEWKRIYWLAEMPQFIFLLLLSGLVILIFGNQKAGSIRLGVIDGLVILFFLYLISRSVIASYPESPSTRIYIPVATFIFYALIRTQCSNSIFTRSGNIIQGIIYLAVFQSIIGVFQACAFLPGYDRSSNAAGLFSNPALFGCFMALGSCLCLSVIFNAEYRKIKIIHLSLFLVIFAGILVSGSRTAWLSACFCCSFLSYIRYFQGKQRPEKKTILVILLSILVIAIAGIYYLYKIDTASVSGRWLIWKISWTMFRDYPIFGMGYGGFYTEYGNYQSTYFLAEPRAQQEILTASMNYYAFSEPLTILIEQGILGSLIFLFLIGRSIILLGKSSENSTEHFRLSSLSLISVLSLFSLFSYPLQDLFFTLLFALSLSYVATLESSVKPIVSLSLGRYWQVVSITLLLAIGWHSINVIQAIYNWKKAKGNILVSEGDALLGYNQAYKPLANNGSFLFNYGSELADLGQYRQASEVLGQAARYGNSVELHLQLGKVYKELGQLERSEASLLKASAMNPKLFLPLNNLMLFYINTGQKTKGKEIAKLIMEKPVKIPSDKIENIKKIAESYLIEL
ncbi:O-antigen ligase family protein [Sphingobacterium detergens]|nr:O-antigen ligase family protein [Sphingobacterium detergens]